MTSDLRIARVNARLGMAARESIIIGVGGIGRLESPVHSLGRDSLARTRVVYRSDNKLIGS